MIASFFQNLNSRGVEYLLISGQATVLYGAATFSEDIDIWIDPTPGNIEKFLEVLRSGGALYYKLTPPFTTENLNKRHGFHFVIPNRVLGEVFVDVMGVPPRSVSFASATVAARLMETEWGQIRTIGLKHLVELKKTQRLEDYPIISNLALAWFEQPECEKSPLEFIWALNNIFTLPSLRTFFEEHPGAAELSETVNELQSYGQMVVQGQLIPESLEDRVSVLFQRRMAALQQADRAYWRDVIAALKELRSRGELMREGDPV